MTQMESLRDRVPQEKGSGTYNHIYLTINWENNLYFITGKR